MMNAPGFGAILTVAAFLAAPALADQRNISGTIVDLRDTERPGALAEINMRNNLTNNAQDNGTFTLTHDGLTVEIEFVWDGADDGFDVIIVTPPEGVVCVPHCRMEVKETYSDTLWLFDAGVGV